MSVNLSLTESQTLQALLTVLSGFLPGITIIRGQVNRVPQPAGTDFITMTPILRERIETNVVSFVNTYPAAGYAQTRSDMAPTKVTVQLDVHGPASADNVQIVSTLFRSEFATDAFAATGFDVTPLYPSEPRQMPFSNGEQQVEERWSIDLVMQTNPIVVNAQQFAQALEVDVIEVEATYP